MIKAMPFFYSSPPKPDKKTKARKNVSASSESDPDSVSLESSTEESQFKSNMKSGNQSQDPEEFGSCPLQITGIVPCSPEEKKHKGLRKKIVKGLLHITGVKSNEKNKFKEPQKEESHPITAEQIRLLIKNQKFIEASQQLLVMEREANGDNLDGKTEEEKLDDQSEIEDLFGLLKQEVLTIVRSSISIAQSQPELLRNAVRAIVDQVKVDERSKSEEKALEKTVCSRSRKWKEDWTYSVQASVTERMEVPPLDGDASISTTAHSFLHMGRTMKEDLITVVQDIKPHYPEHFQVCHTYAKFYHHCFSSQLQTIAQFELGKKDTYLLLSWVENIYPNDIKHHPVLVKELEGANLESLLPSREIKQLESTHLANEVESIKRWLTQCLKVEALRWTQGVEPVKLNGHFHSELPIDVIQVIKYLPSMEHESVLKTLPQSWAQAFQLHFCLNSWVFCKGGTAGCAFPIMACSDYKANYSLFLFLSVCLSLSLSSYKKDLDIFIKENKQHPYYEATIIANINNSLYFRTHVEESTTSAQNDIKMKIFTTLDEIQNAGFNPLFKTFTRKKWVSCGDIMHEIIATTSHYISTFKTLKDPLYQRINCLLLLLQAIMEKIHFHLVREHITRLLRKKVSLRSPEQQNSLSDLVQKNASLLHTFCTQNGSNATWLNSALPSLAEIIKLQDTNAIMVEVSVLANRYPDISKKHLSAILYIKGNLSSSELKSILSVLDIGIYATLPPASLFSTIRVS
ncbi:hypothetical protein JD844_020649 [Phrynosoma platyrhinos]|uniref:Tumor necrosis factor alpha-induced protein 2 n=1 Tax=Phrynosoma platyrhinos TaxID=52577 RepID=A0ABQ7SSU6_PHRPL|nr:hypothetical protein JD844_020649 [Phrynosoma platyrhinos]